MMDKEIIELAKVFIKNLRKEMQRDQAEDLFIVAVKGEGNSTENISVSLYTDVVVGSLARKKMSKAYKAADKLLAQVHEEYMGITSVIILLTDEYRTEVFREGSVLRICNLDA